MYVHLQSYALQLKTLTNIPSSSSCTVFFFTQKSIFEAYGVAAYSCKDIGGANERILLLVLFLNSMQLTVPGVDIIIVRRL